MDTAKNNEVIGNLVEFKIYELGTYMQGGMKI